MSDVRPAVAKGDGESGAGWDGRKVLCPCDYNDFITSLI